MVCIVWVQVLLLVCEEEMLQQLSVLVEILIVVVCDWLYVVCCKEWGMLCNVEGQLQLLLIFGMGKLGGGELNFFFDIDLIFVWLEYGVICGGCCELDNVQFFICLGQWFIKVFDQLMQDGFVYWVDMCLWLFGDSGLLVFSFVVLEDYYQEQGWDWECYVMVKVWIMGDNDGVYVSELCVMFCFFVFCCYIDFSVIQLLCNMKGMIVCEVWCCGLKDNIKFGVGGICEIEFIVQVFQLICGGCEFVLQQCVLLLILVVIDELYLLLEGDVMLLCVVYLFLCWLENLL